MRHVWRMLYTWVNKHSNMLGFVAAIASIFLSMASLIQATILADQSETIKRFDTLIKENIRVNQSLSSQIVLLNSTTKLLDSSTKLLHQTQSFNISQAKLNITADKNKLRNSLDRIQHIVRLIDYNDTSAVKHIKDIRLIIESEQVTSSQV